MSMDFFTRGFRPFHHYDRHKIDKLEVSMFNMIELAQVTAVDKETMKATVTAKAGQLTDVNVFMLAQGSADYKHWTPPVVGDSVLLLSVNGDLNGAYCLPIRLPSNFESNIPEGSITRAGDVTIQYKKDDNTYEIKHGDKKILLDEDKVEISYGDSKATVDNSKAQISQGNNKVKVEGSHINMQTLSSSMTITPTTANISVPGGSMDINGPSFTFNGQTVVLA